MFKLSALFASTVGCVTKPAPDSGVSPGSAEIYAPEARQSLLRLARASLERAVREGQRLEPTTDLPPQLLEKKGCFVTLTKQSKLRGCIGNIYPDTPLAEAVALNAYRAALNDSRFTPVTADELSSIEVEVSVLSVPKPLPFDSPADLLARLRPNVDGVVLESGWHRSTFLPQVWEKLTQPEEFLGQLAAKAGLPRDAWQYAAISTYQVQAFAEPAR